MTLITKANDKNWQYLLEQLYQIDEKVPDLMKHADSEYWVVEALRAFLDLAVKNKQDQPLEKLVKGKFLEANRLVKINRRLPKSYLDLYNFKYIILGGIYVDLPVIIVNKEFSKSYDTFLDNGGFSDEGLPDNYHYGTRQMSNEGYLIALAYNEVCPRFISKKSDWQYFQL